MHTKILSKKLKFEDADSKSSLKCCYVLAKYTINPFASEIIWSHLSTSVTIT